MLARAIWHQFSRLVNIYYGLIAGLQTNLAISNTRGVPTALIPLGIVVFGAIISDLYEWRQRKDSLA